MRLNVNLVRPWNKSFWLCESRLNPFLEPNQYWVMRVPFLGQGNSGSLWWGFKRVLLKSKTRWAYAYLFCYKQCSRRPPVLDPTSSWCQGYIRRIFQNIYTMMTVVLDSRLADVNSVLSLQLISFLPA